MVGQYWGVEGVGGGGVGGGRGGIGNGASSHFYDRLITISSICSFVYYFSYIILAVRR